MNNHLLLVRQLDRQLKDWNAVGAKYSRPRGGWVKALRKAFGMTAEQLAKRLGVQRMRVVQLERAEIEGGTTLRALRIAAEALNCELVYALVPKKPIEEILHARAFKKAEERVASVGHSMALEDQALQGKLHKEQIEQLAKMLQERSLKRLWEE